MFKWHTGLPCLGATSAMSAVSTFTLWVGKVQEQNFLLFPLKIDWCFCLYVKKILTLNLVRELNCSTLVLYGIHKKATARRVLTSSIGTVHVCTLRLQQASHANKSKVKRLASDTIRSLFDAPLYSYIIAGFHKVRRRISFIRHQYAGQE
jgi:hypothetical protein